MTRISYLDTEHCRQVMAHAPDTIKLKTRGTNFLRRAQVKNQLIMRHIFDRLVETCGPYDGLGAQLNYKKSIMPVKLKWGGPKTPFDVHVLAWQLELVKDELISREEVLSPASICMAMKWAATSQLAKDLEVTSNIIYWRRPAVQAGWLLVRDQLKLEELNFPHGYTFEEVTKKLNNEADYDV